MGESERVAGSEGRARWTWLAALGLVLVGIAPLLMVAGALAWGMDVEEELPFFVTLGVVPLVGAFLVYRFGTWAKIVGIVVALAAAAMLFWTAFGLFTPNSFFDFLPGVLVIPGALLAIVSCVAAIIAGRRGHLTPSAVGGEQRGIRIVLSVVVVLAALSGALTVFGRDTVDAADAAAADAVVVMSDFEFDQEEYTFSGGDRVLVRNEDAFLHTFTIEDLDIDVALTPNGEKLVEIPSQPGSYVVFCRPHTTQPDSPTEDDMAARAMIQ